MEEEEEEEVKRGRGIWLHLCWLTESTWADRCVGTRRLVSPAQSPVEPWTTFRIYGVAGAAKSPGQDAGWKGLEHQRGISFSRAAAAANHSTLAR
jgi:hypothetical protein